MTDYTKLTLPESIETIEQVSSSVRHDFGSYSANQLNWKPGPEQWSISECLEHLVTTNGTYFAPVEALLADNYPMPFLGRIPGYSRICGRMLINAVSPQAARKVKTSPVFEPAPSTVDANEIAHFEEHQAKLLELIHLSKRLDLEKTIIASPAMSVIVYSLMDAWRLIAAHELRHLGQARRVSQNSGFPSR